MKMMKKIPVIFLALFIFIPQNIRAFNEDIELRINSKLKVSKLNLKQNNIILDISSDDVNGDYIKDNILIVGNKQEERCDNMKIIIQDGATREYYVSSLTSYNYGYAPKLFLGDFNGDKISDIFVSFFSGGSMSKPFYSIFSFKDNKSSYLFEQECFSKGLSFDITYEQKFLVKIYNKDISKYYSINVSEKKNTYIAEGIYDKKGKLLRTQTGFGEGLSELTPMDLDKDGVYELKAIQKLNGICSSDTLGYVKAIWKYEGSEMNLLSIDILPYAKAGETERIRRVVPVGNFKSYR
jgi:hypothetical protein